MTPSKSLKAWEVSGIRIDGVLVLQLSVQLMPIEILDPMSEYFAFLAVLVLNFFES